MYTTYICNIIYADDAVFFRQGHIVITTRARARLASICIIIIVRACASRFCRRMTQYNNKWRLCAVVGNEIFFYKNAYYCVYIFTLL